MSNLAEVAQWDDGVYQLETTDRAVGGADGIANRQAKSLANRTLFLKQGVAAAGNDLAAHKAAIDPHSQYLTKADGDTRIAAAVAALVNASPAALDTLKELADALGNDPAFAATMTNALAQKAPLNSPVFTGSPTVPTPAAGSTGKQVVNAEFLITALSTVGGIPGQRGEFYTTTAPSGWFKANGAAVPVATYPTLTTVIYCGDANNATALWGYRCNSNTSPSTTRSITGAYIVLPDARGEYSRGWDDGRGVDSGRSLWMWQAGQVLAHSHTASASADGNHQHVYVSGSQGVGYQTGGASPVRENSYTDVTSYAGNHNHAITVNSTGGSENLTRNLAALVCIKY